MCRERRSKTMTTANKYESYLLRLINADRHAVGVAPLKINGDLNTASEKHSAWMLNADVFSHTGAGGSTHTARMQAAGYDLAGAWATGENIAMQSVGGAAGLWDEVRSLHRMLMNSPDHRANLLSATYKDVGLGIELGQFSSNGNTFRSVLLTEDFGKTSAHAVQKTAPDTFVFHDAHTSQKATVLHSGASRETHLQSDDHHVAAVHDDAGWGLFV
jgi:serralysin